MTPNEDWKTVAMIWKQTAKKYLELRNPVTNHQPLKKYKTTLKAKETSDGIELNNSKYKRKQIKDQRKKIM